MTTSSIHFKRVDPFFCEKHNSRETEKQPSYLLDNNLRKSNDFERLLPDDLDITGLHIKQLAIRRNKACRGKAPDIEDSCWEAVINLEEHHTLADVKQVADFIHKEYHLTPISIAIHRDEGYKDKDGTVKYNYHAHIPFYTVSEGKSVMRTIGRKQLSEMQTEVAQLLGMQRGQENSKATRLDHKQYREKAKAIAEVEQKHNQELAEVKQELAEVKQELASAKQKQEIAEVALQLVEPTLQRSKTEKEQLHGTVKSLNDEILSLKEQKAIVEAERKRWKEAHDFVADEYRKLQALNKTLYTKEQLNAELQKLRDAHALRLTELETQNTDLKAKLETKPKEIRVKVPVETVKEIIVPRQLTDSEIEELPRVQELNNKLTKLTNDYNELAKDYRQLDTAYNNLEAEYNLLKRSKTNDDTSECSRVRIDTDENILQAYARTIGYSKSEPEQTDELHGTEEPTQTTSLSRSKGFRR